MPDMTLTSVDLPAPLSPTSPTTSPALTWKSTSSRAWTAPKRLLTPRSSSSGAVAVAVSLMPGTFLLKDPEMPADLHAALYWPVQICEAFQKPSLITVSLMFDLITATGFKITDGTSFLLLLVWSCGSSEGCWLPRTSAPRSCVPGAASG